MRVNVLAGRRYKVCLPYSEVCMYMQVAGAYMTAEVTTGQYPMAQLYRSDGRMFSAPITMGEAGFYYDQQARQYYYYDESEILTQTIGMVA